MFYVRSGHGDAKAAAQFVEQRIQDYAAIAPDAEPMAFGHYYLMKQDLKQALGFYMRVFDHSQDLPAALMAALTADAIGDPAVRDSLLDWFCNQGRAKAPKTAQLCQLLRDALAHGDKGSLDLKAVNSIIRSSPVFRRTVAGTSN